MNENESTSENRIGCVKYYCDGVDGDENASHRLRLDDVDDVSDDVDCLRGCYDDVGGFLSGCETIAMCSCRFDCDYGCCSWASECVVVAFVFGGASNAIESESRNGSATGVGCFCLRTAPFFRLDKI